jgi:hypothetical protein
MTRNRYGLLAGIAGAALAAWYWRSRMSARDSQQLATERGEVIFRNTPVASSEGIL